MESLIKSLNPKKASFGRHETFSLRYSWLTKGFQSFQNNAVLVHVFGRLAASFYIMRMESV